MQSGKLAANSKNSAREHEKAHWRRSPRAASKRLIRTSGKGHFHADVSGRANLPAFDMQSGTLAANSKNSAGKNENAYQRSTPKAASERLIRASG
ncbi:hypothetical protein MRX96_006353 [Rhipicephalus microplus]